MFLVVVANFAAQIPYYFHQYYLTEHLLPSLLGVLLLGIAFAWFLVGYNALRKGKKLGYILITSFYIVEFLFYLQTQITQAVSGKGILLHVLRPDDALLFVVFGVGYINFLAAAWFAYYLLRNKRNFVASTHSTK